MKEIEDLKRKIQLKDAELYKWKFSFEKACEALKEKEEQLEDERRLESVKIISLVILITIYNKTSI